MSEIYYTNTDTVDTTKGCQSLRGFGEIMSMLTDNMPGDLRVARASWVSRKYVEIVAPGPASHLSSNAILCLTDGYGSRVPWIPSYNDLFAWDWIVV